VAKRKGKYQKRNEKSLRIYGKYDSIESNHKGTKIIDKTFVFDNRKARYKTEEELFETY
jgi:hypothetical protein